MAKEIQTLEFKEVTIGDNYYIITAMGAEDGMAFLDEYMDMGKVSPKKQKEIIVKYVKANNKVFTDKSYDIHFSRKYKELGELFLEVFNFNFEGDSPLEEMEVVDTSDK